MLWWGWEKAVWKLLDQGTIQVVVRNSLRALKKIVRGYPNRFACRLRWGWVIQTFCGHQKWGNEFYKQWLEAKHDNMIVFRFAYSQVWEGDFQGCTWKKGKCLEPQTGNDCINYVCENPTIECPPSCGWMNTNLVSLSLIHNQDSSVN